jgi:hypothetical protein
MAGIIISCEKDKEDEPGEDNMIIETLGNNSAILEGEFIGDSSESTYNLRRIINAALFDDTGNIIVDKAYICRASVLTSHMYWIIPAENNSGSPLGFIKANNIQFKNSEFNLIGGDEEEYIYGELGQDNLIFTTTFLSAGAKGYFTGIKEIPFNETEKIEINNIESETNNFHISSIKVIPVSYGLSGNKIIVKVKNKSTETVYAGISPCILLDSENLPLFWDYIEPVPDSLDTGLFIKIDPGETINFEGLINYRGKCKRILPIIDFGLNPY